MELDRLQAALARLCLQPDVLAQVLADPETSAPLLGLTPAEARELAAAGAGIATYAATLHRKRSRAIRRLVERSATLLGPQYEVLFQEFAAHHAPADYRQEAIAFALWAGKELSREIRETLRLETTWISAARPYRFVRILRTKHTEPGVHFWCRLSSGGRLWYWRWPLR